MARFAGFLEDRLRRNLSQWLKTFDIHRHVGLIESGLGAGAGLSAGRWLEAAVRATEWSGDAFLRQRASGMLDRILGAPRQGTGMPFPWMTAPDRLALTGALEAAADLWRNGPAEALLERLAPVAEAPGRVGLDPATVVRTDTTERLATLLPELQLVLARTGEGLWGDVIESLLWNQVFACQTFEGDGFYASTPLHGMPPVASELTAAAGALMLTRLPWTFYSVASDAVRVLQYGASEARLEIAGRTVELAQVTSFPDGEEIAVEIRSGGGEFTLNLRIPGWCRNSSLRLVSAVDGDSPVAARPSKGFVSIHRKWQRGDKVVLQLPMVPVWTSDQTGAWELRRGPLRYCFRTAGATQVQRDTLRRVAIPVGYPGPVYEVRARLKPGEAETVTTLPFACAGWGGSYQTALSGV